MAIFLPNFSLPSINIFLEITEKQQWLVEKSSKKRDISSKQDGMEDTYV
jgi:hypothetical protein